MDFSSPEKALHFIKAIGIRKNKKISTQKTTEKNRPSRGISPKQTAGSV